MSTIDKEHNMFFITMTPVENDLPKTGYVVAISKDTFSFDEFLDFVRDDIISTCHDETLSTDIIKTLDEKADCWRFDTDIKIAQFKVADNIVIDWRVNFMPDDYYNIIVKKQRELVKDKIHE